MCYAIKGKPVAPKGGDTQVHHYAVFALSISVIRDREMLIRGWRAWFPITRVQPVNPQDNGAIKTAGADVALII